MGAVETVSSEGGCCGDWANDCEFSNETPSKYESWV